jgi:predicted RNase H-like HicB family nuclease
MRGRFRRALMTQSVQLATTASAKIAEPFLKSEATPPIFGMWCNKYPFASLRRRSRWAPSASSFDSRPVEVYTAYMKREQNFSVVIERDKEGYFVMCPELQGCYSQGKTYEEALSNIKEAIELHVEDILASGEELPETESISLSTVGVLV